jgi:hypothetical protein
MPPKLGAWALLVALAHAKRAKLREGGCGPNLSPGGSGRNLAPVLMHSAGCQGSTATQALLRRLIAASGWPVQVDEFESLKASKNAYLKYHPQATLADAALAQLEHADSCNLTMVQKVTVAWPGDSVRSSLMLRNARVAIVTRWNPLDVLVCKVRDCFGPPALGRPVDGATGALTDVCFQRRSTAVRVKANLTVGPKLLMRMAVRPGLETPRPRRRELGCARPGRMSAAPLVFTSEELLAFEYATTSATEMDHCHTAWEQLLRSVGVPVNRSMIESALAHEPTRTRRYRPHSETIWNAADVRASLDKRSRALFWRD